MVAIEVPLALLWKSFLQLFIPITTFAMVPAMMYCNG